MDTKRLVVPAAEEVLGLYFPVLDHGFVALLEYMGGDSTVVERARTSYGLRTRRTSSDEGLLRYLVRKRHTSPFEQVQLTFHIGMPIFVARQLVRHRTQKLNEYSGRYSHMPMLFYTPEADQFGAQSDSNKQGRGERVAELKHAAAVERWQDGRKKQRALYEDLLSENVARELARIDLPLSTYTYWQTTIDLHNLMHMLGLRYDVHAQWEIREFARIMLGLTARVAPLSMQAWDDFQFKAHRFSRMEMQLLRNCLRVEGQRIVNHGAVDIDLGGGEAAELFSKREISDFLAAFQRDYSSTSFALDLTQAKTAEFFADHVRAATPTVDQVEG